MFHIRNDLGLNKQSVKRKFYRWHFKDGTRETDRVAGLLEMKTYLYPLEDLGLILKYNLLERDLYAVEHPEEFKTYQGGTSILVPAAQARIGHHMEMVSRYQELVYREIGE